MAVACCSTFQLADTGMHEKMIVSAQMSVYTVRKASRALAKRRTDIGIELLTDYGPEETTVMLLWDQSKK